MSLRMFCTLKTPQVTVNGPEMLIPWETDDYETNGDVSSECATSYCYGKRWMDSCMAGFVSEILQLWSNRGLL